MAEVFDRPRYLERRNRSTLTLTLTFELYQGAVSYDPLKTWKTTCD